MVAPTWRIAVISAEPDPLRSADSAPRAAFIAGGIASPSPSPATREPGRRRTRCHCRCLVKAPSTSPTAMTANPTVTRSFTPTSGGRTEPSAALRGVASRVPPIMPTTMPPIIGSSRTPAPSASRPRTSWKYCGIAKKIPNIANETSVARIVPQVKPADRNTPARSAGGQTRWPAAAGERTLPGHERGEQHDPGGDAWPGRGVRPAVLASLMKP